MNIQGRRIPLKKLDSGGGRRVAKTPAKYILAASSEVFGDVGQRLIYPVTVFMFHDFLGSGLYFRHIRVKPDV